MHIVTDSQIQKSWKLLPHHNIKNSFILLFQFDELHPLQVAVILRNILQHVLVTQIGQIGCIVLVLTVKRRHLFCCEKTTDERVVFVGHSVQKFLSAQPAVGSDLMPKELEHGGDANVRFPSGHIFEGIHVFVYFKQCQCVQICGFSEKFSFEATLIVKEPQILLKVLIADILAVADEKMIFAMQVVLEGNGHHAHFFQFVKTLQMSNSALWVLQQIVFNPSCHI